MNTYLVYYAYYHNDVNAHELNTNVYVANPNVLIAKVRADTHFKAEDACINDLNLRNAGYVILTTKL